MKLLKIFFNLYTVPAILITVLNVFILINDTSSITWIVIVLNLAFWLSGILLYKKKNLASLIAIIPIIYSFMESISYQNNIVDPYLVYGAIILFYFISDVYIFYKKDIKYGYKRILTYFLILILSFTSVFSFIDYNLIKNNEMPRFMILIDSSDGFEYIGLGYTLITNEKVESRKQFSPNAEYSFRNWFYIFSHESLTKEDINEDIYYSIEIEPSGNNLINKVLEQDDFDVYSVGLDTVIINVDQDNYYELEDYFINYTYSDFEEHISHDAEKEIFKDGGSTLYKTKLANILFCNTIDENKDIYIGDSNMLYEDDFCK